MRVVILPIFNEGHLIPLFLQNMHEVVKADLVIMNEGFWPTGPEGDVEFTQDFLDEYVPNGRSFDLESVKESVFGAQKKYPDMDVVLNEIVHPAGAPTEDCERLAYSYGLPSMKPDDVVFILGADEFIHEKQADLLTYWINQTEPNRGILAQPFRFTASPKVMVVPAFPLRLCMKWGDGSAYRTVFSDYGFVGPPCYPGGYAEDGPKFDERLDLNIYHYEWLRPDKYFDFRMGQLNRHDDFWEKWIKAMRYVRKHHSAPTEDDNNIKGVRHRVHLEDVSDKDIDFHPEAIRNHRLFKGVY